METVNNCFLVQKSGNGIKLCKSTKVSSCRKSQLEKSEKERKERTEDA